ncbi:hypothetical protein [Actinomadura parmotrematis]|uniref:Polymer-forming cytoskeletal protein n=1 Tax=Actinomadura parmotrematis TaxID=2864039 RepID=A0ABS7FLK3_9ACTN|nr:hypothetical protein [Actinomadura parmotrematis]MBW8481247.1 hypothetical protein [Actinomadura parmotrematis]
MGTRYLPWDEAVELFERRGLPESAYENLYDEEYILVEGPAVVDGDLPLDEHGRTPWARDTPGAATGYIVDGDLTVTGTLADIDDGSAALVVLGSLTAGDVYLEGDAKILTRGDLTARAFVGYMTEKLVMVHGDLRTRVAVLADEFAPDLVTGTLSGRVLAPDYLDLAGDEAIGGLSDPAPDAPLADLLVPEVLGGDGGTDGDFAGFAELGLDGGAVRERVMAGLPLSPAP